MLRSDLSDYSDVYVAVTGKITVASADNGVYDKKTSL